MAMTSIKPVSDLRDYNKILKDCTKSKPVMLTKNGRGVFVVMSIDEYNEIMTLLSAAQSAHNSLHVHNG